MARPRAVIENTVSEARDHLANERTFLAWVRTALALVGLGVLVPKLSGASGWRELAGGVALIAAGAMCLIYSGVRYVRVAHLLMQGSFPVATRGPMVVGATALGIAIAALLYLLGS